MATIDHLSIVVPVFDDEEVLAELHRRLKPVVVDLAEKHEIIFVDDGSRDGSLATLERIQGTDPSLVIIQLARNFGQQNAIAAGLRQARGEIIVLMDSDLQDRPEDIPTLIDALEESGCAMAIAKWVTRQDSFAMRKLIRLRFKLTAPLTSIDHSPQLGVFRAIRRHALDAVKDIPETTGSILSLLYWSGFSYVPVDLHRDRRFAGKSGYDRKRLFALASDRCFSHSTFPVRIATYAGIFLGLASVFLGGLLAIRRYVMADTVPGWTSLIVILLFLFGVNFVFMGLLGEYLRRIYLESKGRPPYITEKIIRHE